MLRFVFIGKYAELRLYGWGDKTTQWVSFGLCMCLSSAEIQHIIDLNELCESFLYLRYVLCTHMVLMSYVVAKGFDF